MTIQCPSCQTRFHYADERFGSAASKKIRCSKCATIFEIRNPAAPPGPAPNPEETGPLNAPILGADDFSLDTTVMGRGPRPKPVPPQAPAGQPPPSAGGFPGGFAAPTARVPAAAPAAPSAANPFGAAPPAAGVWYPPQPQQAPFQQPPQQPNPYAQQPGRAVGPGQAGPAYAPQTAYAQPPQVQQVPQAPQWSSASSASSAPQASPFGAPPPGWAPVPDGAARRPQENTAEFPRLRAPGETDAGVRALKLPENEKLSLACIAGPDAGRIFEIDRPRMIIGRSGSDILISDPECSRQHAAVEVADEKVVVVDLGSTNGTYFNERRIAQVVLENRGEFDVGSTTLMLIKTRKY